MTSWALVDQQHNQDHVGVVGGDGVGDVLQHHRLPLFGGATSKAALAFADGGNQVDDPAGGVFFGADVAPSSQAAGGMQGVRFSNRILCLDFSGASPLMRGSTFTSAK